MTEVGCEEFHRFDFPDYAQEFLRRNREYRAQYRDLVEARSLNLNAKESAEMAHFWGLEFPVST